MSLPAIRWDTKPPLRPGYDFRDGRVFVTLPAQGAVTKTKGRGKDKEEYVAYEPVVACITNDPSQFIFDEDNVTALGYEYPSTVMLPSSRRWSERAIANFLSKQTEPPDPFLLYSRLRDIYVEFIEFADERYYDIMPLFVMSTYVFRLFKSFGYIHFNGTAASGKSQNLRMLQALAFNTVWASNMSSPALFRTMAGNPGTICIDEAESFESERGQELRQILNAGYIDGAVVARAERGTNEAFRVVNYEAYGPKVLASINPLDDVLASRSLVVTMMPAVRTIPEFDQYESRWQQVRDNLYLWTMHHSTDLAHAVEEWNSAKRFDLAPKLRSRQWQVAQTYLVLADYIDESGKLRDDLIEWFNAYYVETQRSQDSTDRMRLLLKTLPRVLREKQPWERHWYNIKDIHELVKELLEEDQTEYFKTRTVSKNLASLGFRKRRSVRNQGTQVYLTEEEVRECMNRRRVEPFPEDEEWLLGATSYAEPPSAHLPSDETRDDLWARLGDTE